MRSESRLFTLINIHDRTENAPLFARLIGLIDFKCSTFDNLCVKGARWRATAHHGLDIFYELLRKDHAAEESESVLQEKEVCTRFDCFPYIADNICQQNAKQANDRGLAGENREVFSYTTGI